MVLHALNPGVDQLDRHLSNHFIDLFEGETGLVGHDLLVEALDEGKVLLGEEAWLIFAAHLVLTPFLGFGLFLGQLGDHSSELKDLVVDRIHLILVLKQVVLVDVLNLKLVVLCSARLNAVTIVEHPERVLTWSIST